MELKIFEDQVLYEKVKNWWIISIYFNEVYKEETDFWIKDISINSWHKLLQDYMKQIPQEESIRRFIAAIWLNQDISTEIVWIVHTLQSNNKVKQIIKDFYDQFETLL